MTLRTLLLTGGMGAAIVLILLVLASAPRPAPAAASVERTHKADQLPARRLEPTSMPPPEPQPLTKAAPAPALPVLTAIPARPPPRDICTRHHGWKVITDNGRSWHCAYAR
jgi:hypothetical protein